MKLLHKKTIDETNIIFKKFARDPDGPKQIVDWVLERAKCPIVSTNFRPYESAILHLCTRADASIPIVWCDTGYNTQYTYLHAQALEERLSLNILRYIPSMTTAHINASIEGIPKIGTDEHEQFTKLVKLEPFQRAMTEIQPNVWFTNIRMQQTELRKSMDILTLSKRPGSDDTILKVSPFYYWSDKELDTYLKQFDLPNEQRYFDPTKGQINRECGLHTS